MFIQCQNLTNFQQVNYFGGQITITATDQTLPWSVLVNYLDGSGWVTLSANSGTGDAIISVNVVNDQSGLSSPLATRTAIVTVQSLTSPTNNSSCTVTQQIYDNTGYIPPNPNP